MAERIAPLESPEIFHCGTTALFERDKASMGMLFAGALSPVNLEGGVGRARLISPVSPSDLNGETETESSKRKERLGEHNGDRLVLVSGLVIFKECGGARGERRRGEKENAR